MTRTLKITTAVFILLGLLVSLFGCGSKSDETASENQVATVQRGNITVDITAAGNLALSRTEELAFELFYPTGTMGTVEEVLVDEGDPVEEGQVLARVDSSEWEEQLTILEDRVTTAERLVTAKQRALVQVKLSLIDAENALDEALATYVWPAEIYTARERVRSAESDLEEAQAVLRGDQLIYDRNTGEYRYLQVITAWDIKTWTQKLVAAEATLRTAQLALDELLSQSYAEAKIANAEERLRAAEEKLDKLLAESEPDADEIEKQRTQVELAQEQLKIAQEALEAVAKKRLQLEQAEGNVEDAQLAIADAEKALEKAREELADANSKSPLITAPFKGFVTQVNVEGGDEIKTGTIAVVIADPNKFEAEILVSEMDILQIKEGGAARVTVDAMSGLTLPATVTHISPTATIQSGVVNYRVKVEIQSLETVVQQQQAVRQEAMEQIQQGELPERLKQAVEEGRITREQAEEMMKRIQQAQGTQQSQVPMAISENFQLREGLTVTVSIIVAEATDVLLVPNSAITTQSGQTFVQVVAADGTQEQRAIQTGISDYQFTEVTGGLSEGEQIIVPPGTVTTPATQQGQRPQGGMFFMGRPR